MKTITEREQCYFVGMHNKPGMKPLDSKTMSGKMIDAVIKELPFKCTNGQGLPMPGYLKYKR